jgi:hypothetical protein
VGELVDRDRGQAQADHGGDLGRVDPQLESLPGADHGGQRHQAGHGEDDLGGDGDGVEQVPGAAVMDGPHQPVGAAPVHVIADRLALTGRPGSAGGGLLARNPPSASSWRKALAGGSAVLTCSPALS